MTERPDRTPDTTHANADNPLTSDSGMTRRSFGRVLGAAAFGVPLSEAVRLRPDETVSESAPALPQRTPQREELCDLTATELVSRIQRKQVSAREVMAAHLARIERVNPKVNAIVTLLAERALADARQADEAQARGDVLGPLHGLPVAHKDLLDTSGVRTTRGSRFYSDNIPTRDALIVTRIRQAGALMLGKTNTPELGAGSQTFNAVFGATRNPYDTTKTCGGSSGGAAVALACGMLPIADGSDTGGSLRNPAAFCNVVGFRPSPGRVPADSGSWVPLTVLGPMARNVSDVSLFLGAIAGPDPRSPLSLPEDLTLATPLNANIRGARVAWWNELGGIPFEPEIRRVVDANRAVFEQQLGCFVEENEPDFTGVDEAFPTLRHPVHHANAAALAQQRPEWVKDTIKWEIAQAERKTGADIGRALALQARMHEQSRLFFERYDYFVLPVTQVSPFDVTKEYPTEIDGAAMASYIDWMRSCWYITFMGNPAISVPAGFTASGLPVGLQIVGRHRGDRNVLRMAYAFEQATKHGLRRPPAIA